MQEREKMYPKLPGHDLQARAAQTLGILYASTSILVPVSFWLCYETLRSPTLHHRVSSELNANRDSATQQHDFSALSATPFLQSLHAETSRKYGITIPARQIVVPTFALDEKYSVPQGTTIIMPSKYAAQYTPGWSAVRPSLVSQPLDQFWPERFLISNEKGEEKERFSDAGLIGNWTSFGGGAHHCPGRFWARNIGMVMLGVFVGEFEVEVSDVERARGLDPVWHESAFGTARPRGKIAARIRRRV
jgi:cytochrome P450